MLRTLETLYDGQLSEINSEKYPHRIKLTPPYYVGFPTPPLNSFTIVKTHKSYGDYQQVALPLRTVYVRRDCRDAILSYYFWTQPRLWGRTENEIVFDNAEFMAFLVEKLPQWMHHVRSWLAHVNNSDIFAVSYEDMKEDYCSVLQKLIEFIGVPPVKSIEHCHDLLVTKQEFKNTPIAFYRKGIVGDWKNYFAQEHIDYINAKAGRLMQRLGYV